MGRTAFSLGAHLHHSVYLGDGGYFIFHLEELGCITDPLRTH